MATELGEIKAQLAQTRKQIDQMRLKLGLLEGDVRRLQREGQEVPEFAQLEGAWSGADFTEAEIDGAKIKARDLE